MTVNKYEDFGVLLGQALLTQLLKLGDEAKDLSYFSSNGASGFADRGIDKESKPVVLPNPPVYQVGSNGPYSSNFKDAMRDYLDYTCDKEIIPDVVLVRVYDSSTVGKAELSVATGCNPLDYTLSFIKSLNHPNDSLPIDKLMEAEKVFLKTVFELCKSKPKVLDYFTVNVKDWIKENDYEFPA